MTQKRRIKPLAPKTCPQCGGEKTFIIHAEKIECGVCGYIVRAQNTSHRNPGISRLAKTQDHRKLKTNPAHSPSLPQKRDLSKLKPSYLIANQESVPLYVKAAFTTAMDHVHRQDWEGAIRNLKRCIEYERDFIEAHLWLARLLEDPDERREHVTSVLAINPSHAIALHELMILNGEIDPDISYDDYRMAEEREAGGAVHGETLNVRCPQCGSPNMSDDDASGMLYCESCGHRMEKKQRADTGMRSLTKAMIKRRFTETVWKFDTRLIQCNSCGAKRTISKSQLTQVCPFCASRHVIQTDALGTFEQPDSIVPFAFTERQALAYVQERLNSRVEKLKGWFVDNRVERIQIEGVFLPFWVFDTVVEVSRTAVQVNPNGYSTFYAGRSVTEKIPEMMNNIPVPGVESPPAPMLNKIGRYDMTRKVKYKPELIAQHSAEIYVHDFDKAAMSVYEIVGKAMRREYEHSNDENERQVTVFSTIKNISFTLMLLPVWSSLIYEKDGDVRPALVNGQTGHVALGKATKPA